MRIEEWNFIDGLKSRNQESNNQKTQSGTKL
jgi:hypothetical protein